MKINKANTKNNHRNHQANSRKVQLNRQVVYEINRNTMIRIEKQ